MNSDDRIVRTDGVLEAEVDGDRVLLHPGSYTYFGLTGTGAAVWDLIDGERSLDTIVGELSDRFEASPEVITGDVTRYVGDLVSAELVAVVPQAP